MKPRVQRTCTIPVNHEPVYIRRLPPASRRSTYRCAILHNAMPHTPFWKKTTYATKTKKKIPQRHAELRTPKMGSTKKKAPRETAKPRIGKEQVRSQPSMGRSAFPRPLSAPHRWAYRCICDSMIRQGHVFVRADQIGPRERTFKEKKKAIQFACLPLLRLSSRTPVHHTRVEGHECGGLSWGTPACLPACLHPCMQALAHRCWTRIQARKIMSRQAWLPQNECGRSW